jgi:phosphate starvation-inducible PhoH-like protein
MFGLVLHALRIVEKIEQIHITRFHSRDVVRHYLVQKIVEAYDDYDLQQMSEKITERRERLALQKAAVDANDAASDAQYDTEPTLKSF